MVIPPTPEQAKPIYKDYLKEIRSALNPLGFNIRFNRVLRSDDSPEKIMRLKHLLESEERRFPSPDEDKLKEFTDAKF